MISKSVSNFLRLVLCLSLMVHTFCHVFGIRHDGYLSRIASIEFSTNTLDNADSSRCKEAKDTQSAQDTEVTIEDIKEEECEFTAEHHIIPQTPADLTRQSYLFNNTQVLFPKLDIPNQSLSTFLTVHLNTSHKSQAIKLSVSMSKLPVSTGSFSLSSHPLELALFVNSIG